MARPIPVHLEPTDRRHYLAALRHLRRILGPAAPDLGRLIHHQLTGRDSAGLADEYLDSIGWPPRAGRSASLARRLRRCRALRIPKNIRRLVPWPRDPTRN